MDGSKVSAKCVSKFAQYGYTVGVVAAGLAMVAMLIDTSSSERLTAAVAIAVPILVTVSWLAVFSALLSILFDSDVIAIGSRQQQEVLCARCIRESEGVGGDCQVVRKQRSAFAPVGTWCRVSVSSEHGPGADTNE